MYNKVNEHLHMLLNELFNDCTKVVEDYEYARRRLFGTDPKEYAMRNVNETIEDIKMALEVFVYADMMTVEERKICDFCARTMEREALTMVKRTHLKWEHNNAV